MRNKRLLGRLLTHTRRSIHTKNQSSLLRRSEFGTHARTHHTQYLLEDTALRHQFNALSFCRFDAANAIVSAQLNEMRRVRNAIFWPSLFCWFASHWFCLRLKGQSHIESTWLIFVQCTIKGSLSFVRFAMCVKMLDAHHMPCGQKICIYNFVKMWETPVTKRTHKIKRKSKCHKNCIRSQFKLSSSALHFLFAFAQSLIYSSFVVTFSISPHRHHSLYLRIVCAFLVA